MAVRNFGALAVAVVAFAALVGWQTAIYSSTDPVTNVVTRGTAGSGAGVAGTLAIAGLVILAACALFARWTQPAQASGPGQAAAEARSEAK